MAPSSVSVGIGGASSGETTTTAAGNAPSTVAHSGLVAHWKFDEGSGTTVCDSSGTGNTGTLINGPLWSTGKLGNALYFDGIDDTVVVADSNSLDLSSAFTISAWVNPASTFTDFRSILVKNYSYYLYASVAGYCGNGNPLAGFSDANNNTICEPSPLPINTWSQLAVTYDGSALTLYRNGVAVANSTVSGTLSQTTGTLQIGASQFGEYFKGLIDEVRIYNRALSSTEIRTMYQQVAEAGLVAHWKFDEGTGTSASDSSGNGHTGTLINGPLWSTGQVGNALYFDGINDKVTIPDSNSLDLSSAFTISAWVNPASSFADFRSILVKNYRYYLYASVAGYCGNGNPLGGFQEVTHKTVCQASPLPINTWTHLAVTYNGSVLMLYRNGVAIATSNVSGPLSPTTGTLEIGASQFGEYFKGLIDEVRIYNRALSSTEIQTIYEQDSGASQNVASLPLSEPSADASALFTVAGPGIAKGVTRYADSSLTVTSCTNYSPSTRRCSGGNEIAYGGPLAIENAANASAATDQILVRSGGPTYIGTGNSPFKCVVPRHGTSTSSRFLIRGYQDEIPTLKCIFGGQYVHFYQLKIEDGQADGIGVMGFSFSRFENLEVSNHGAQGISFVDNSELINLNVHHNGFNSPNHCQLPGGGAQCHGVYADDSLLIHGGKYHHNEGMGIHCYTHCRNTTIRNLHAYANKTVGVGVFNSKPNPGVAVYNVLAYKNGTYGLDASAEGIYYNITAVNNGVAPVRHGMLGTIKNSILLGEYSTATFHFGTGKFLGNSTASNNIITGSAASLFVDRANGNF